MTARVDNFDFGHRFGREYQGKGMNEVRQREKRIDSIELFRCLLMYGIVLLHCIHRVGGMVWAEGSLLPCVSGFVFITGWFGLRFAPSKVLRIYGVQLYCAIVCGLFRCVDMGVLDFCSYVLDFMGGFWFGHAYVLMMFLAPLINHVVDSFENTKTLEVRRQCIFTLLPFFFVVFVWGWVMNFNVIARHLTVVKGLNMYGGLALLGIYAGARLCRCVKIERHLTGSRIVVAISILGCVLMVRPWFGFYNCILSFVMAMLLFCVFRGADLIAV